MIDLKPIPSRIGRPDTLDDDAEGFFQKLPVYGAELVALQGVVVASAAMAALAEPVMQQAIAAVGAVKWISGTTYTQNAVAISQVNFQTYRRRVAGAGTVDPANDSANWALLIGRGSFIPQPVGAGTSIDLSLGNYFTKSLSGNQTLTFDNCPQDGYSFTMEVAVTGGVLTLPSTVRQTDNIAYTLTAGKTHLLMFVTSNRGARWRMSALANFDN